MKKILLAAATLGIISAFSPAALAADDDCVGIRVYRPDLPNRWTVVQLFNISPDEIAECNRVPSGTVNRIEVVAAGTPNESLAVHVAFRGEDGGWFAVPKRCAEGLRFVTNERATGIHEGWASERNDHDADGRWVVKLDPIHH